MIYIRLFIFVGAVFSDLMNDNKLQNTDNVLDYLNRRIKNLTENQIDLMEDKKIWNEYLELSKRSQMFDSQKLKEDMELSSMLVVGNKDKQNYLNHPKSEIFNAYKPLNEESNMAISLSLMRDFEIYDGDIIVKINSKLTPKKRKRSKRKTIKEFYLDGFTSRWPLKIVPYEFDAIIGNNFEFKNTILEAINHWETKTCIQFEPFSFLKHGKTHKAKVQFSYTSNGCFSNIGYPDQNSLSSNDATISPVFLSTNCVLGQIIHEIGHVIGFFHEQAREDRDQFIDIIWQNIDTPEINSVNFQSAAAQINNIGVKYDINSIMHYQPTAFGKNGSQTIVSKDKHLGFLMGNRVALSFYDIKTANIAYKCSENCLNPPTCQNDGFLNSSCQCVCPDRTAGIFCETHKSTISESVSLNLLNLSCTFSNDLCSWNQEQLRDEVDFTVGSGASLLAQYKGNSGPLSDRNGDGKYLYLNTYYIKYPNESAILVSPLISVTSYTSLCLKFFYHMFADRTALIGQLFVYMSDLAQSQGLRLLWSKAGRQTQSQSQWLSAQINIYASNNFRVVFKAQRYMSYFGDIGIDDFSLTYGSCSNPDYLQSQWSEWYLWGPCSVSCGSGVATRERFCQVGSSGSCEGSSKDATTCWNQPCFETTTSTTQPAILLNLPIDGGWSEWSSWSTCDQCNLYAGFLRRTRACNNPSPLNNGKYCAGLGVDYQQCYNSSQCMTNGAWSVWSDWSSCNVDCGAGTQTRNRICNSPSPNFGGSTCQGLNTQTQTCFKQVECSVQQNQPVLTWSSWSSWSDCSATCDLGYKTRSRTCLSNYCGAESDKEYQVCSYGNCQSFITTTATTTTKLTTMLYQSIDDICGGYCSSWSAWSNCGRMCGASFQTQKRTRSCLITGKYYYGCLEENSRSCSLTCDYSGSADDGVCLPRVDGEWSEWGEWSTCSSMLTCGANGIRTRKRTCAQPEPLNGGLFCSGSDLQQETCQSEPCDSCYQAWSSWSSCSASCGYGYSQRTKLPLQTQNCLTKKIAYDFKTCSNDCNQKTIYSEWSSWTVCSNSDCQTTGSKYRFRSCIYANCSASSLVDKKPCQTTERNLNYDSAYFNQPVISCVDNSCQNEYFCSFDSDNEPNCNFKNLQSSFNFQLNTQYNSAFNNFMPPGDFPSKIGRYLLASVNIPKFGDVARIETDALQSLPEGQCLKFYYFLNGLNSGVLNVKLLIQNVEYIVFSKSGSITNDWIEGSSLIPGNSVYKIRFEYIPGTTVASLGIDHISVKKITECQLFSENFETEKNINLMDEANSIMKWRRVYQTNSLLWSKLGFFYYLIDSSQYLLGQYARFTIKPNTVIKKALTQSYCLSFAYMLSDQSRMNIFLVKNQSRDKLLLWNSMSSTKYLTSLGASEWRKEFVDFEADDANFEILVEAVKGWNNGLIGLDEVFLEQTLCYAKKILTSLSLKKRRKRQTMPIFSQNCGGTFNLISSQMLFLTSPNYPNYYPINIECSYLIKTSSNNRLVVDLLDMDLESTNFNICPDSLEVRYYAVGQMGVKLCGSLSKMISSNQGEIGDSIKFTSLSDTILLNFKSDWVETRRGFYLRITTI